MRNRTSEKPWVLVHWLGAPYDKPIKIGEGVRSSGLALFSKEQWEDYVRNLPEGKFFGDGIDEEGHYIVQFSGRQDYLKCHFVTSLTHSELMVVGKFLFNLRLEQLAKRRPTLKDQRQPVATHGAFPLFNRKP